MCGVCHRSVIEPLVEHLSDGCVGIGFSTRISELIFARDAGRNFMDAIGKCVFFATRDERVL